MTVPGPVQALWASLGIDARNITLPNSAVQVPTAQSGDFDVIWRDFGATDPNILSTLFHSKNIGPGKGWNFSHLAMQYEVMGVPKTVVNGTAFIEGAGPDMMIVEKIREAVEAAPNHPTLHYHLAVVYERMGNKAQAIESAKKALAVSPEFPEAEETRKLLQKVQGK